MLNKLNLQNYIKTVAVFVCPPDAITVPHKTDAKRQTDTVDSSKLSKRCLIKKGPQKYSNSIKHPSFTLKIVE